MTDLEGIIPKSNADNSTDDEYEIVDENDADAEDEKQKPSKKEKKAKKSKKASLEKPKIKPKKA